MSPVESIWAEFAACVAMIAAAGPAVCRLGESLAAKTGLSITWIGLILVAAVTSLPELVTGITAVSIAGTPDIAVGDVFGSCVFNLTILVVLDFMKRDEPVYRQARQEHVLSAGFGIALIGFAGWCLTISHHAAVPAFGHVGLYSPVILVFYVVAVRSVFFHSRSRSEGSGEPLLDLYPQITLPGIVLRYVFVASVIVGAGVWLPFAGGRIADTMGWNQSFVGTLLVAAATSLPELVVTIAAVRMGAAELAIASLLGSNLFDMAVLAVDDIAYLKGPILEHVSPIHASSALAAVIMSGVVVVGLAYRPGTRLLGSVGWISVSLLAMYLLNSYALFLLGH